MEVTRRCPTGVTHRAEVLTDRHAVADLEGLGDRLEVGHVVANSVISEDRNRTTSARCRVVDTRIPGVLPTDLEQRSVDRGDQLGAALDEDVGGRVFRVGAGPARPVYCSSGEPVRRAGRERHPSDARP